MPGAGDVHWSYDARGRHGVARFGIERDDGEAAVRVSVRIRLVPDEGVSPGETEEAARRWGAEIVEAWSGKYDLILLQGEWNVRRYSVSVTPLFVSSDEHHAVRVVRAIKRANEYAWPLEHNCPFAAHEFGHMLGNDDEYRTTGFPSWGTGGIMKCDSQVVKARHYRHFARWLSEATSATFAPAPRDGVAPDAHDEKWASAVARSLWSRDGRTGGETAKVPAGERVGPYTVLEPLGEGAQGAVFEALDASGTHVALKVLRGVAPKDRARFLREAEAHRKVQSAWVARLFDAGEATLSTRETVFYLAFELVLGGTLRDAMSGGRLDEEVAARIALDVARGLRDIHASGLVHRDLKPENVLMTATGAKITDFGLVRETKTAAGGSLTQSGAFVGTVAYASPEQIRGDPATPRSDVWAFGALFYEVLTGAHPFAAPNAFAMAAAISNDPVPMEKAPAKWRGTVERSLSRDLARRFDSGKDLLAALAPVAEGFFAECRYVRERAPWVRVLDEGRIEAFARAERGKFAESRFLEFQEELTKAGVVPLDAKRLRGICLAAFEAEARYQAALARVARERDASGETAGLAALEGGAREAVRGALAREVVSWQEECVRRASAEAARRARRTRVPRAMAWLVALAALAVGIVYALSQWQEARRVDEARRAEEARRREEAWRAAKPLGKNERGFEEYEYTLPDGHTTMVLISIPGAEFRIGSENVSGYEKPVHRVVLDGYVIGKYEVTNAQYRAFVRATGRKDPPQPDARWGYENYFRDSRYDEYPVVWARWEDAKAYCDWAGLALPSEAQWEYAARGKDGREYPWGNDAPHASRAQYEKSANGGDYTKRVGSFPKGASAVGALDMGGNVWEWCADWFDEGYYAGCGDGMRNPTGPAGGSTRVVRGGSWCNSIAGLHGARRGREEPGGGGSNCGFRVARSLAR